MNTVNSNTLATFGKPTAPGVADPAKTFLVTLPRELIIEIIKACDEINPIYVFWGGNRKERKVVIRLSCVNKLLRILSIPFAFRVLDLVTSEDELHAHLQVIIGNKAILEAARFLFLETDWTPVYPHSHFDPSSVFPSCGELTCALLVKFLSMMRLEELRLELRGGNESLAKLFGGELAAQRVALPSVEVLYYSHPNIVEFIPTVFANLRVLSLAIPDSPKKKSGLIAIASELHRLEFLELRKEAESKGDWNRTSLEEIVELFPSISGLQIHGSLGLARVSDLISVFKKMANLKELYFLYDTYEFEEDALDKGTKSVALEFFRQCAQLEKLVLIIGFGANIYLPVKKGNKVVKVKAMRVWSDIYLDLKVISRPSPWTTLV